MKKLNLIALFALILHFGTDAQIFEWAKSFGATSPDQASSVAIDTFGNVYTTGYFKETVDFDPGAGTTNLTSAGGKDIFVQKMDATGNFLWAKALGGVEFYDKGYSITVDDTGNIYITGSFEGTVDFDPGTGVTNLTSNGYIDIFVLKMDASGNFLWARTFGGTNNQWGTSITTDGAGNVYTTGLFLETADFDPGAGITNLTSTGSSDIFVQKMDASGNFLWARAFGGTNNDLGNSIAVDDLGNVYTTGFFQYTADFDPGPGITNYTTAGDHNVFVQKMDASGNFLWARAFGGTNNDEGLSTTVDAFGNVYTTGFFKDSVDFDPGAGTTNLTSIAGYDIFVQKMDASGNFLWAKAFGGGTNNDQGNSITTDALGNVYTTGYFSGTVDFDPGAGITNITTAGGWDGFVQKMDASGNFLWAKSFGGTGSDGGQSSRVDAIGNVYTAGYFSDTVYFDLLTGTSILTSIGNYNVLVHKLTQCASTSTDVQSACNSLTWIDGITYTASNNTAIYILTDVAGCDSVVALDLTINSNTGTDVITSCNSYTWINGNTYTTSNDTAIYILTNAAGCDSVVTLDLTINSVSDLTTSVSGITITANNSNASYQWLDCDNNNAIISGENGQASTAITNGNYAVELTENGCVDTTACVAITTVGIIENSFGENLFVYPNPTRGNCSIDLGSIYNNLQIRITDISGKLINSITRSQSQIINLSIEEPAGVYFITVEAEGKKAVVQLMKE